MFKMRAPLIENCAPNQAPPKLTASHSSGAAGAKFAECCGCSPEEKRNIQQGADRQNESQMSGAQSEASPSKHIIIHCLEVGYFRFMASDVEPEPIKMQRVHETCVSATKQHN